MNFLAPNIVDALEANDNEERVAWDSMMAGEVEFEALSHEEEVDTSNNVELTNNNNVVGRDADSSAVAVVEDIDTDEEEDNNNDDDDIDNNNNIIVIDNLAQVEQDNNPNANNNNANEDSDSSSGTPSDLPSLRPRRVLDDSSSDDDSDWGPNNIPHLAHLGGAGHDRNMVFDDLPFAALLMDGHTNRGPDIAFFQDFCRSLQQNDSTEMYRYYVSRQERLITLMVREADKAQEFEVASRNNTSLDHLHLDISHRFTDEQMADEANWMGDEEYYRRWATIGQGISNLHGLQVLQIHAGGYLHNQNTPDLTALRHVLEGARQIHKLVLTFELVEGDELGFVQALEGHEHLTKVEFRGFLEPPPMQAICNALLTVPNLSRIDMMNCFSRRVPCRILPNLFFSLLGMASMRELVLQRCCFSEEQCEMLAAHLSDNKTAMSDDAAEGNNNSKCCVEMLDFQYSRFKAGGVVAKALATNTSVNKLVFSNGSLDEDSCMQLAETLLLNTSITRLQIETEEREWAPDTNNDDEDDDDDEEEDDDEEDDDDDEDLGDEDSDDDEEEESDDEEEEDDGYQTSIFDTAWFKPIFVALQTNSTLNFLCIGQLCKWNDETADAFRAALESPTSGIQDLWLHSRSDAAAPWRRIVPALKVNRTLKSFRLLSAVGHAGVVETAAALSSNTTLEALEAYPCSRFVCVDEAHGAPPPGTINGSNNNNVKKKKDTTEDDCVSARAVEALGRNNTLKKLMVDTCIAHHTKDVSEMGCKKLVTALGKNFGLEDTDMSWGRARNYKKSMESIARLNGAGRRYLLTDPSDRQKGVHLLGEVSDSVDCLFMHLQENPSLCEECSPVNLLGKLPRRPRGMPGLSLRRELLHETFTHDLFSHSAPFRRMFFNHFGGTMAPGAVLQEVD